MSTLYNIIYGLTILVVIAFLFLVVHFSFGLIGGGPIDKPVGFTILGLLATIFVLGFIVLPRIERHL